MFVNMRILEARFHPGSKARDGSVAVGRVLCDDDRVSIEPVEIPKRAVQPFDSEALLSKLRFLADSAVPHPFDMLVHLRSNFWSFVELSAASNHKDG